LGRKKETQLKIMNNRLTNFIEKVNLFVGHFKAAGLTLGFHAKFFETHFFSGYAAQRGLWPSRSTRVRDHTQRRATVGRTPMDE
jgi:hypothetical protein